MEVYVNITEMKKVKSKTNVQEKRVPSVKSWSTGEEVANSITHGIGVALGTAALVLLVVFASIRGDAWRVVSFSIYGTTLILLYLSSTLYHSFTGQRLNVFSEF
ncbi:unnamed protein product [marine sediment metagenome]|uniref:Hemolysin III n=1 Tax=marine sediment metagenome TaxID=412755 RepID=X1F234_9ZZZZ